MAPLPPHKTLPAAETFPWPSSTESFWRTELHPLDSYRSTPELPPTTDIAIIGAGMTGVSTTYHILKACANASSKPSITILEARQLCSGATGRNGGHLKLAVPRISRVLREHGVEAANEIGHFHVKQIQAIKEVVDKEGLDCDFLLTRSFDVFMDENQAREQEREVDELREAGIDVVRTEVDVLRKEHVEAVTGVKGAAGARSVPAASLWPYKFVTQLMSKIVDQVNLQTHTMVKSVTEKQDVDGFYTLSTTRGTMKTRKVIFATNAYTAGLFPSVENVITPFRGTASRVVHQQKTRVDEMQKRVYTYNIWKDPSHVDYLNHRLDGSTIIGGAYLTFEDDVSTWLATVDDSSQIKEPQPQLYFEGRMERYYQDWADSGAAVSKIWTGIQGRTPDGFSFIGEIPGRTDQYIMAGFNGADDIPFEQTGIPRILQSTSKRLKGITTPVGKSWNHVY